MYPKVPPPAVRAPREDVRVRITLSRNTWSDGNIIPEFDLYTLLLRIQAEMRLMTIHTKDVCWRFETLECDQQVVAQDED